MYDDNFRNRHTERRERPDGKGYDIVVLFYTQPLGGERTVLQEITVQEKLGPNQATEFICKLDEALAGAYIQGRYNQKTRQHRAGPIPATTMAAR